MDKEDILKRLRGSLLSTRFPELMELEPVHTCGPAERELRRLRRSRGPLSAAQHDELPVEHRFVYQTELAEDRGSRTVVVVTDVQGDVKYVIESR